MCFPILKYMALKTEAYNPQRAPGGSVTAYTLENTKLDVMRNGKTEKGRIDKDTIFRSLKLMEQAYLVKATEEKVCRDGRVRKKYAITPQGVVALLQGHPEHVEISKEYVRGLAEMQKSFLPLIFGKWNYFCQQQLEEEAYKILLDSAKHGEIWDQVYPLAKLNEGKNAYPRHWTLMIQEDVYRHGMYGGMFVIAWLNEDEDSPWGPNWVKAIRNDKGLLEMARTELQRLRLEEEIHAIDWDHELKRLDSGNLGMQLNMLEGSTDPEQDSGFFSAAYRHVLAHRIDKGESLITFHDLTMSMIDEVLDRRTCPKCGEINATSSFQLAKPCEKCGEKLDPNQLTARFAPPDTPRPRLE